MFAEVHRIYSDERERQTIFTVATPDMKIYFIHMIRTQWGTKYDKKNLIRLIGQTKFKSWALSSIDLIFFVFTSSCFEKLLRNIQRADIGGPGGEGATPLILGKERSQRGEKSS